ncbi:MAG: preprotein translocase subunit SecG [Verrucomicrobiales bacterium]|nr:preprotein translocase subunit SecG [Verrucomicrobiales bacterium]
MAAIISILLTAIIIIASILLVLIVLVQRPKQEGLGAAFGGGAFDSALGAHTTDVLQKITTWLAVVYFTSAVGLAMVKARQFSASPASNVLENVDKRDAETPELPAGISNLPNLETETTPAPLLDDSASETPATPEGDATPAPAETPAPAAEEAPPAEEAPAAPATETPAPAETAPAADGKGKGGQ